MPPRQSRPMSAADAPSEIAAIRAQSRESLWAIGLGALLVAAGLARRSADQRSRRDDRAGGDDRRGWSAEGPSEIPALGWKDILLRVYNGISDDRILANAAGVTYYALLALFPGIAARSRCGLVRCVRRGSSSGRGRPTLELAVVESSRRLH
jgi:hypothetical protein